MNNFILLKRSLCGIALTFAMGHAWAAPITYYDLDFEDGLLGGTVPGLFNAPTNIAGSALDGRALEFDEAGPGSQIHYDRNDVDANNHFVSFDYFAEAGANVTFFLDVPTILRFDFDLEGRHHVEIFFDLAAESIETFVDGLLDNSYLTIAAFGSPSVSSGIRFANQPIGPGLSTGDFQIDNVLWQGDVQTVSEPETALLLLVGIGLLGSLRRKRNELPAVTA